MVCNRCKMVIKTTIENLGYSLISVELGEIEIKSDNLNEENLKMIDDAIRHLGFELIDNRKGRLIEKIKVEAIQLVHYLEDQPKIKTSEYLASKLHYDYTYLSNLFSEVEGITIEQFIILQKIEKVKELLVYDELSLSEIAHRMGYSSVAHLSTQFKKITGLTPAHFKKLKDKIRKPLDNL